MSAALATVARSPRKDGFVLDEAGYVQPTNDAAGEWLEAGLFDDVQQLGTRTYQDRMAAILGFRVSVITTCSNYKRMKCAAAVGILNRWAWTCDER